MFSKLDEIWLKIYHFFVGDKGVVKDGIRILGSLPNIESLPSSRNKKGDCYLIAGALHLWDGLEWGSLGLIRGPAGPTGATGMIGVPADSMYETWRKQQPQGRGTVDEFSDWFKEKLKSDS